MKERDPKTKNKTPTKTTMPRPTRPATLSQLKTKTTDELVHMLLNPDMSYAKNTMLREQIITILQQREGNAFVQHVLSKSGNMASS